MAQSNNANAEDDEFNIFLLTIETVFVCGMIGAAIVGAMGAALVLFFLFSFMAIGVLSTSVAIGLYKRSFATGFKSFLIFLFGIGSSVVGAVGLIIARGLFHFHLSGAITLLIGFTAGMSGGIIMGFATYKVLQSILKYLMNKWNLKLQQP